MLEERNSSFARSRRGLAAVPPAIIGDGGVRFVRDGIDPVAWRSAGTRTGGEVPGDL